MPKFDHLTETELQLPCTLSQCARMLITGGFNDPKDKLIYRPMQIEAMIDQNTTIAQQLTLWDQKGSRVIRET
jgi:hypothetical protein